MSYLKKLKDTKNRKELAELLGFEPSALTSIIYKTPIEERYVTFEIPKKSGGVRTIKAPNPKLKRLQSHLSHVLQQCLVEIEAKNKFKLVSHGFRRGGTLADNAKNHKRRRYVFNFDIADFFPSFNFGRVRGFFLKDKSFELAEEVATTIAQIACDGVALPQGSPCSPIISELIGQIFDQRMLKLAKKYKVTYSRYADDITISTNRKDFPDQLAIQDPEDPSSWTLGEGLIKCVGSSGFAINPNKTRMHCRGSRQTVTNLVVNAKVNIRSEYYRDVRAMCHSLFITGRYFSEMAPQQEAGKEPEPKWTTSLNPLEGMLSYVYYITQSEERRSVQDQRKEPRAIRRLYRRFLFYKNCIALKKPLIITEGKTDPIYLREAIKRRAAFHAALGKKADKRFEYNVGFFNYAGQTHEIMDMGGGSGDLKSVVLDYLRNLDPNHKGAVSFKCVPKAHPVILILDNDDGLAPVAGSIKKNFGIEISQADTSSFYHITQNLYLVKTPEKTGVPTSIEDLFADKERKHTLNGKSFNPGNKIDPEKEYGKEIFAKRVIQPNAETIDFSGFDPLLTRIVDVLNHYKSAIKNPVQ